jgi:hypothetical protein
MEFIILDELPNKANVTLQVADDGRKTILLSNKSLL